MQSTFQPLKLWGAKGVLNSDKVALILHELDLPHERIHVPFSDVKNPEFVGINPNGRLPALHDPNTDISVWESGAIIEYLIEVYDKDHRLTFEPGTADAFHAKQWLIFQLTGQAPYYGQIHYFRVFHSEKLPSAVERFIKEANRVSEVLQTHLMHQKALHKDNGGGPWLVGQKMSYADLAFVPWQRALSMTTSKDEYDENKFPLVKEWLQKMLARESGKIVFDGVPDKE